MWEAYTPEPMAALFAGAARLERWLEVELAVLEAQEALAMVPRGTAASVRRAVPSAAELAGAVEARRAVTVHEMAAFVDVVGAQAGAAGRWVHFGLTSADVMDTATGMLLARAVDLLSGAVRRLVEVLASRARELGAVPALGRTHGMHAEPTTFGAKLALWALRAERDLERLGAARRAVAVGTLSGPVGTYANLDPRVEALACGALGVVPAPSAQFVSRDRHAEYLWACASVAGTVEALCTQVRLLHQSEVAEVREPFREGQKGSSSMPHKQNPVASMELCGLGRVVRGYLVAAMESTATWYEGDTTALSAERVVLPDASALTLFMAERAAALVGGLVVDEEAMGARLAAAGTAPFSSSLLHALVAAGVGRDVAYRAVQAATGRPPGEAGALEGALAAAGVEAASLGGLEEALDLARALRHVPAVLDALPGGPPAPGGRAEA